MEKREPMPILQILLFDCPDDMHDALVARNYSVKEASFGKDVKVEYDQTKRDVLLPLLFYTPSNTHEFDIMVIDMCGVDNAIEMDELPSNYRDPNMVCVEYPKDVFFNSVLSSKYILAGKAKPKKAIYLIFEGDYLSGTYKTKNIKDYTQSKAKGCTYDFLKNILGINLEIKKKSGNRTMINGEDEISNVLKKYNTSFSYQVTFEHPIDYEFDGPVKLADFIPLVLNADDEIVAFQYNSGDDIVLMLPQTDRKTELVTELLENVLPSLMPKLFPENTKFLWLPNPEYALPNSDKFAKRKQVADEEHDRKIQLIDADIEENKKEFGFLHAMLKETDAPLVDAVIQWLKWLGFEDVIDADKATGKNQEDIDIIEDGYIIIAEVKGIGRTSTDSECAQISKHRRRFEKANRHKSIHPIYIVNHQRFSPPDKRDNPPFSKEQIDYAINDERGLLTTYQLFRWFYAIEKGIFTKGEIRDALRSYGLISFIPAGYNYLGRIKEYYQKPKACILDLDKTEIKIGDSLVFVKDDELVRAQITSIMVEDKQKDTANNGEVGICVDADVGKGYDVYLAPN